MSQWYGLERVMALALGVAAVAAVQGCDGGDTAVAPDSSQVGPSDLASASAAEWPDGRPAAEEQAFDVEDGRLLFLGSCAACHGTSAQGMPHQGPDLRSSAFVSRSSHEELVTFLASGRPPGDPRNVSGLPMPPRGGNPALTDRHLRLIVEYLRSVRPQPSRQRAESLDRESSAAPGNSGGQ
jgi:disulfide bond formation protein DsbB